MYETEVMLIQNLFDICMPGRTKHVYEQPHAPYYVVNSTVAVEDISYGLAKAPCRELVTMTVYKHCCKSGKHKIAVRSQPLPWLVLQEVGARCSYLRGYLET